MGKIKFVWVFGVCFALVSGILYGQGKYLANDGKISFYSHTAIEDISAENANVSSVIDAASGEVAVIVLMTGFQFEKKLMQEHFNENYVESEKYPKATFNGKIVNNSEVDYSSKGKYPVQVEGDMLIHGIKKHIMVDGSIEVIEKAIIVQAKFLLNPEDYEIKIPRVVRKNIAERLEISITLKNPAI